MITDKAMSLEFLQTIYCNDELPLPVRMRAAIASLPFENAKLAVTYAATEHDFASLLDQRIKKFEQMKLIEAKPTNGAAVEVKPPLPRVADRRFRRI
jgi:hypothetical protein